ncbi:hypothetical protein [Sphingomonas sp. 8AM]|uniref:hypothetical protein n=1 Tax=Sphingomonas sp. 8AM TaxID=2653170 RepID=UPI0012F09237|nr:hypothetical protein [Sphingomonas sp. 8AM]VXD02801.1 conserved hypothetical protein [Sphingomonas sp. 8AM]
MAQHFEVMGPNGETYEVEAPEGATEQDVIAQVQKASRLAPDDEAAYASLAANPRTGKAELKAFAAEKGITLRDGDIDAFLAARNKGSRVSKRVVYENLPKAPKASLAQNIGAAVGTALDGVLPGVARTDRGIHGVINNAVQSAIGDETFDPAAAFQQGKDEQDYAQARFGVDHSDASTVASGLGMVAGLTLPEARVVRGAGLLPGMANAALTAGGYGALSGVLNETGGGNLENMALGAGVGGVIGAGGTLALRGAVNAAGAARRTIPGADATARFLENVPRRFRGRPQAQPGDAARAQAERILAQELPSGTIATGMGSGNLPATPDNITAEVARRTAMGVPAVPADVTEPGRRITSWALQGNGPSTSRARQLLMARQAGQGTRIRGHITDELGPAVDPIRAVDDINRRASAEAAPMYAEAYAQPMVLTPQMRGIMQTPAFQDAVPHAIRNIRNAQRNPEALGFVMRNDGTLDPEAAEFLSTEGFDQVIRAMRDNGQAAMDTSGFRPRNTTNSVHINARASDLRNQLADQNGAYRDVTGMYADEMGVREALTNGQDVAKLSGPEIAAQMGDMRAPNAREAWTTGARTALADDATQAGLKPTANVAQRIRQALGLSGAGRSAAGGDVAKQEAIEAMAQRPGAIGGLDDRLEAEDQAFKTAHEVFGNSKTAPREVLDEALSGHGLQVAAKIAAGQIVGAISSLLFQGNPRGAFAFKRDVQDRIAEIMTAEGAQNVQQGMEAIMRRAQADAAFAEMLNRAGVRPTKLAAAYAAALDAEGAPEEPDIQGPAYTR